MRSGDDRQRSVAGARPASCRETAEKGLAPGGRTRCGRISKSAPSGDNPPPGITQWRWGWCTSVWPQVCSTAMKPMSAPRWLRVGGDGPEGSCGGSEQGAVDYALVLQCQRRQLGGQGEDDVEIGDRQQILRNDSPARWRAAAPDTSDSGDCGRSCTIRGPRHRHRKHRRGRQAWRYGKLRGRAMTRCWACDTRKPGTRPSAAARVRMTSATSKGGWCTGSLSATAATTPVGSRPR